MEEQMHPICIVTNSGRGVISLEVHGSCASRNSQPSTEVYERKHSELWDHCNQNKPAVPASARLCIVKRATIT